mmetsp:Transcript_37365/g.67616  ORF Transcript_37365/g.67616 Transcript_37365/m.67616 type:complete len:80 (+) Transcript_37365:34-273(+)
MAAVAPLRPTPRHPPPHGHAMNSLARQRSSKNKIGDTALCIMSRQPAGNYKNNNNNDNNNNNLKCLSERSADPPALPKR